jgi:subtilisin-like proprotein convertase family protein/Ca2+-binding EF-hand superfamily protein
MLENAVEEVPRQSWRPAVDSASSGSSSNREDRYSWRRGGSSYWLSASVLERFDSNQNGRLEVQETQTMGMPVGQIDIDRDGALSRDELFAYLSPIQEEAGQLSEGIPGWFFEFDSDRDRQVSMAEFSSVWTPEQMNTFTSLDLNGDGLLTIAEVSRSKALMGGSFVNRNAEVLPPGKTVISEIEITDDIIIADLNVQLSITHTNAAHLDGFLTGPDGQRFELFTEVGGSDNNFDETIFDDQAELPIVKAAPPFKGSFIPEAVVKHEPSLSHFTGKNARGVWQLVIRGTRSERFGMLHGWSLMIRLEEQRPVAQAVVATEADPTSSEF